MIVDPYTKARPAPPTVALLTADAGALVETGELAPVAGLEKGVQVWASQDRVLDLLREGRGSALCWRGQPIRYEPVQGEGFRVRVIGLPFPEDDGESLDGLRGWRDWLAGEGAAPAGSLGSSSMSLLRAKLERRLYCSAPRDSAPPLRYTVGARQELGPLGSPAEYVGVVKLVDLRSAYARTLAGLEYGGFWHRMRLDERRIRLVARSAPVFCRARVTLTGRAPGPLVKRERSDPGGAFLHFPVYPVAGRLQGLWTWQELEEARWAGARVSLLEAWFHSSGGERPFLPWWRAIEKGRRSLPGFAQVLCKATGNSLWGQFCVQESGRRSILRYERANGQLRRRVVLLEQKGGQRPAHDLSELLTGMVRAELFRMMVLAGEGLCSAHTDGGWIHEQDELQAHSLSQGIPRLARLGREESEDSSAEALPRLWSVGDLGSDWRVKATAERLRVLDPQMLAYRLAGESEDRYVVSGWPARLAGEQFERLWAEATKSAA